MLLPRLAEIRREKGLSQRAVAAQLGIPQQQYSRYEKGVNEIPLRHVITLCRYYGISSDWLLELK